MSMGGGHPSLFSIIFTPEPSEWLNIKEKGEEVFLDSSQVSSLNGKMEKVVFIERGVDLARKRLIWVTYDLLS